MLSWESVLDSHDAETSAATTDDDVQAPVSGVSTAALPDQQVAVPAGAPTVPAGAPTVPPADLPAAPPPPPATAPVADDGGIELTIAPLSLDPLTLDPPPTIADGSITTSPTPLDRSDVLGDVHLQIAPLELDPSPVVPEPAAGPAPAAASIRVLDDAADAADGDEESPIELTIAPLDIPGLSPSGSVPTTVPAEPTTPPPAIPEPAPADAVGPGSMPDVAETAAPATEPAATSEQEPSASGRISATMLRPSSGGADSGNVPVSIPGLPDDPVSSDGTPTTVLDAVTATAAATEAPSQQAGGPAPTIPSAAAAVPARSAAPAPGVPVLQPSLQPNQATLPKSTAAAAPAAPAALSRKDRKHQTKLRKQQQKVATKQVKAASSKSGGSGVALFFTLLVLVGLIAGALIFGRPYLFPDAWDEEARPYGEAVEAARGAEFDEPLLVERRAADVFATAMTAQLVGSWESDLPTWRSLGLVSGPIDAPLLNEMVQDWTAAYYSPETGAVIANDAAGAAVFDAAVTEAMAAAALDQEVGWAVSLDDTLFDAPALTRAIVTASSRTAAAATVFGAADRSGRDIGVSTFLPPVLEYRVNAPLAYSEFSSELPAQRSADFEALRVASQLQLSGEPELVEGDVAGAASMTDRTFWYLVFASYNDPSEAYAASNALVQASLTSADSAGRQCNYATFSGTDVDGTERLSSVLGRWVAAAPAEMNATVTTLANGTMQLRSCDPGEAFDSGARFGLGREIARLRSVELAALAGIPAEDSATADRGALIAEVRAAQVGLPMLELPFDTSFADSAEQARTLFTSWAAPEVAETGE